MSDELVAFVRARLDERAAKARDACEGGDGRWRQEDPERYPGRIVDQFGEAVVYDEGCPTERQAAHIVAGDPARVLREVEGKRRRLERHQPDRRRLALLDEEGGSTSFSFYVCIACTPNRRIEYGQDVVEWPCREVRDDAAVYADHPDYRQAWRP
ncbi:DUF6221 family protein [Streptomyces sp. NPDC059015]|uniref:DUF6221 family protein n=1 Tax=unclassified Streptomyces TaxID=2593676 RepID=UPI003676E803